MQCRVCKRHDPASDGEDWRTATRYADCAYRCPNQACCVAYSNARSEAQRRLIHPQPELNVPAEVREGLYDVLDRSLNINSRRSKRARFAFETSEDALTWTCFRYLQMRDQLGCLMDERSVASPQLLLWGATCPPVADSVPGSALKEVLEYELHEQPDRFTEPDVVLSSESSLIFIEVKYQSANDRKPNYGNFGRYLSDSGGFSVFRQWRSLPKVSMSSRETGLPEVFLRSA